MNVRRENAAKKVVLWRLNNIFSTSNPAVGKLMIWKQSDEEDNWAEKAIGSLVRRLKNKKGSLEELERALTSPGMPTRCVTIRRTADGRLQISHRKVLPHIISCRIWRWPDLQINSELEHVEYCQYAYSKQLKEVCINPYHYQRIDCKILPPVLVPRYNSVPGYTLGSYEERHIPQNVVYSENGFTAQPSKSSSTSSGQYSTHENSTSHPGQNSNEVLFQPNFPDFRSIYENYTNSDNFSNDQQCLSADKQRPVAYQEPQKWCSISYYEFNFRVGEQFICVTPSVIVDGFTNPEESSNRFCLGQLSNAKRTSFVEAVRSSIGEGVLLYHLEGKVHVKNLSKSSIFVQSRILNQQQNFHVSTVCKIPAGYSSPLEIFDNYAFSQLLHQCANCSYDAVYELRKMCTVRLSFVKGWGRVYQRDDITCTPCWIEVHFHGPLKWLDKVIQQMGKSEVPITSVS